MTNINRGADRIVTTDKNGNPFITFASKEVAEEIAVANQDADATEDWNNRYEVAQAPNGRYAIAVIIDGHFEGFI